MNFGEALEALKQGNSIAREGWNGKGIYVYINYGSVDITNLQNTSYKEVNEQVSIDGINFELIHTGDVGTALRLPNLVIKSASGAIVNGWVASTTDLLANDWTVLPTLDK